MTTLLSTFRSITTITGNVPGPFLKCCLVQNYLNYQLTIKLILLSYHVSLYRLHFYSFTFYVDNLYIKVYKLYDNISEFFI